MAGRAVSGLSKLQKLSRFIRSWKKSFGIIPHFTDVETMLMDQYPEIFLSPSSRIKIQNLYKSAVRIYKKKATDENQSIKTKHDVLRVAKKTIEAQLTVEKLMAGSGKGKGKTMVVQVGEDTAFFKIEKESAKRLIEDIKHKSLEERQVYYKRKINQENLHNEMIDESMAILRNQKNKGDASKISYIEKISKVLK